jgi:GT2 family glycosyltransferase
MNRQDNGQTSCPVVSVVTPSFNQGPFIEKTVRSVLCQRYPNIEYIVVDGGSTDQTHDVLHKYRDRIDQVMIGCDRGQADALHKGLAAASGTILAYLNSDDCYVHPDVVARMVDHFHRNDRIDVIYGPRLYVNETGHCTDWFPHRPFSAAGLVYCDFIPQECAFWTRRIYEHAGAFIDRDLDFAIDYELWLRMLRHGARFVAIDEPIALFRCHATQKTSAQWQAKGLKEVRRLQIEHHGRSLSETEMAASLRQHLYGCNGWGRAMRERGHWAATKLAALKRKLGWSAPLDGWVDRAELQAPSKSAGARKAWVVGPPRSDERPNCAA